MRTFRGKLEEAKLLDKEADALTKRDPEASAQLRKLAQEERRKAVKMKRRKRRKATGHMPPMLR